MTFDIERLVNDLGGARQVSSTLNTGRSVPYGWIRRGSVSSAYLSQIKQAFPSVCLDQYFMGANSERLSQHSIGDAG
jgi:hypothetical protein